MRLFDRQDFEPAVGISAGDARKIRRRDLLIRFAFGAAISTVASLISILAGIRAGGLMLAFPAILPATLTLLEQEESKRYAAEDDLGSVLGAIGLAAFAGVAWWLIPRAGGAVGIVAAGLAWFGTATGCYFSIRALVARPAGSGASSGRRGGGHGRARRRSA
jgi:hypothetical protein